MAFKSAFILGFLLFLAFCNVPIRGRDVDKRSDTIIKAHGENSSSSVRSGPQTMDQYMHIASYYANGKWHGIRAKVNVWTIPDVQPKSYSAAYLLARNEREFIAAGVHVYPGLYSNNDLRFFTSWASFTDGKLMGCFNTQCNGYVVAPNTNTYPGQALAPPFSTYRGEQKYITLRIKKDEQTGDWSLYREDQGGPMGGMTLLGWWPKTLFGGLSDPASQIAWKGEVSYHFNEKSPSMGSGHYAEQYEGRAAFFKNILAFDSNGNRFDPEANSVALNVDKPYCYDASAWFKNKHGQDGFHFFYGGPSGCNDKE